MNPLRLFRSNARKSVGRETVTIDTSVGAIHVDIRRNAQARRLILRVPAGGNRPVVTVPRTVRISTIRGFLIEKSDWIAEQIGRLPKPLLAADAMLLPVRGSDHRLVHRPDQRGAVRIEAHEPPLLIVPGEAEMLHRKVTDWLKRQARVDLAEAVSRHTQALSVSAGQLSVRDTASRWGSCASSGNLSFSWRLILAPPHVLNYVAAHEVAHLKEMNHGTRFWAHVEALDPDMKRARSWLRQHGGGLHRILPKKSADQAGSTT